MLIVFEYSFFISSIKEDGNFATYEVDLSDFSRPPAKGTKSYEVRSNKKKLTTYGR